jgi:RND family efflux transporter MFP subunit
MEMTAVELDAPSAANAAGPEMYTCPMHPQIVQDHEGTCPICGMELVPKADDTAGVDSAAAEAVAAVKLSPLQAVLADVTPVHPERTVKSTEVPAIGEVKVPQDQVSSLVSWQPGRIDNLILRETGSPIAEGEHLLDIYSEELVQAQDEYLLALEAHERLGDSEYATVADSTASLLDAARKKLLRLGMTAEQLAELEQTRQVQEHIPLYARHGGIVMDKMVTDGEYVKEGSKLFSVADLDPVWVEVEVFERDAANLQMGDSVTMLCPIHPGMIFRGTVELIEPSLDPMTRTHRARVVVDNPDLILRPGLVLDARLTVNHGEIITLPRNAVLHTGDGDLVYVMAGENQWEPRRVVVGRDFGDTVEILSGLTSEDAVAGTAVFLLDSEAQLKGVPRPLDDTPATDDSASGGAHAGHQH